MARLVERALKGEWDETRPSRDEPKGGKSEVKSVAQLKCMYTDAHSRDNKQEELEGIVRQKSHDTVTVMETQWDDSHGWSSVLDVYKLFRRDRRGRRGGGVTLCVREALNTMEIEVNDNKVGAYWQESGGRPTKLTTWWKSVIDNPGL